ncbi:MAG: hypothetical protein P8Y58_17785 [Novosphingobium sp.]
MAPLLSAGGAVWATVFTGLWLLVGVLHLCSLRSGYILGITAGPRAIKRSERPVRFWLIWFALVWPFVILPAFVAAGTIYVKAAGR